jgi:hypothetical protein
VLKGYLRGRPGLTRAFVLIDSRHGILKADEEMFELLDEAAVAYQVVLTKADKIKPAELEAVTEKVTAAVKKHPRPSRKSMPPRARKGTAFRNSGPRSRACSRPFETAANVLYGASRLTGTTLMEELGTTARILSEALPFLQRYDDQIIVVKYGGHAMVDPNSRISSRATWSC